MKRSRVFQKPSDDYVNQKTVLAKSVDRKIAAKLADLGGFRDFVTDGKKSQEQLSGDFDRNVSEPCSSSGSELSTDEKNRIEAKILKAEMKGNMELVEKLRRKLANISGNMLLSEADNIRILMKTNQKTGLTAPVIERKTQTRAVKTMDGKHNLGSVESVYHTERSVKEMMIEEKETSAESQLKMFGRAVKSTDRKADDDWVMDDMLLSVKRRKKYEEKDQKKMEARLIRENKLNDWSLESCTRCIQSSRIAKHCIVAVGIKTYLTVPTWKPLVDGHCLIVPAMHYSCSVSLDEDVYDEMRIWRKGLVAMWSDQDKDCVFIEMAKNVKQRQHMVIECIPLPSEVGDTAPIYFKKAIDECEHEWSDNKKLIDLSKKNGDIRKAIPKGFSYFAVDFGLQPGYAHVIEDESHFPQCFAYETIGGMLDLLPNSWRRKEVIGTEVQMACAKQLKKLWGPYDWTEKVKNSLLEERND